MIVTRDSLVVALRRVGLIAAVEDGYFDGMMGNSPSGENPFGWFNYDNSMPSQSPIPGVWTTLLNDGNAITTDTSFPPPNITRMLDTATGRFLLDELDVGDEIYIRHTLNVVPMTNNLSYQLSHLSGSSARAFRLPLGTKTTLTLGAGVPTDTFVLETRIFINSEDVLLNGIIPQILVSGPATVEYTGCYLSVNRR